MALLTLHVVIWSNVNVTVWIIAALKKRALTYINVKKTSPKILLLWNKALGHDILTDQSLITVHVRDVKEPKRHRQSWKRNYKLHHRFLFNCLRVTLREIEVTLKSSSQCLVFGIACYKLQEHPPHCSYKPDLFAGSQIEPLLQTLNRPFIQRCIEPQWSTAFLICLQTDIQLLIWESHIFMY